MLPAGPAPATIASYKRRFPRKRCVKTGGLGIERALVRRILAMLSHADKTGNSGNADIDARIIQR